MRWAGYFIVFISIPSIVGCSGHSVDWSNPHAPPGTGFIVRQWVQEGRPQNYSVFIPHDYDPRKHYPVIIFLHGLFESGTDGRKCVAVGIGPTVSRQADTFPFIVIFPQSTGDWQGEPAARWVMLTLDQVLHDYPAADAHRVILAGVSTGGDATWSIGAKHANRFAGLVPMSSGPDVSNESTLTHIPIWAFHNRVDPFRGTGGARDLCVAINRAGGNAAYTEYPEFGHDCWTRAFGDPKLIEWIANRRR